jgi:hypothetical protein
MFPALVLAGALALGQPPAPPQSPAPTKPNDAPAETPCQPEEPPAPTPDKWLLMRSIERTRSADWFERSHVSVYGWTNGSFTASTNTRDQLPMGFNYRANEFLLQQNWLRLERTVDTQAHTLTWGFRSDTILPGTDYRFTIARGLWDDQLTDNNGGPNLYGIDPVQFYGELYLPGVRKGLDVKFGRFFAQYGAESIDATLNVLGSRSYTFIYNPFTHTGLLTTLQLTDAWSVQNGIVTGSDMFVGPEATPTYIGSVKWAPPEGRDSVLVSVIVGKGRSDVARAFNNPEVFDVVYVRKINDKLTYTLDALYSFQTNFPGVSPDGFVNAWGAVQYLTYQLNEKWAGTTRVEFFGDPQGWKTGFRGTYTAVTGGVTYKPRPGLWLRPEIRFDHNDGRPFEGKPALFTAAFDFILRW